MLLALSIPLLGLQAPLLARPSAQPPLRARPTAMVAADPSQLYGKLDAVLRRARKRAAEGGLVQRAAGWVSGDWTDKPPEKLVETTLNSGRLLLDDFDEGLELLLLAEEESEFSLSGSAYAALMRLGLAEGRERDVLALLGRLQARGDDSPAALVSGMRAATALSDWGAVARLHAALSAEAAGPAAFESADLEVVQPTPSWTNERVKPPPGTPDHLEAFELALRAHCERGDVPRAIGLVDALRERGRALPLSVYEQLANLARRTRSPGPLLALTHADVLATAAAEASPVMWDVRNRAGMAAANLGTVERAAVAAFLGFVSVYMLASLLGVGATKEVDPFDGW